MNKKKKPHLLIVGGSGFIGYHLAIQAKKKEWKVTSISIHNPNRYRYIKGVNYLKTDIKNLQRLKKKIVWHFYICRKFRWICEPFIF